MEAQPEEKKIRQRLPGEPAEYETGIYVVFVKEDNSLIKMLGEGTQKPCYTHITDAKNPDEWRRTVLNQLRTVGTGVQGSADIFERGRSTWSSFDLRIPTSGNILNATAYPYKDDGTLRYIAFVYWDHEDVGLCKDAHWITLDKTHPFNIEITKYLRAETHRKDILQKYMLAVFGVGSLAQMGGLWWFRKSAADRRRTVAAMEEAIRQLQPEEAVRRPPPRVAYNPYQRAVAPAIFATPPTTPALFGSPASSPPSTSFGLAATVTPPIPAVPSLVRITAPAGPVRAAAVPVTFGPSTLATRVPVPVSVDWGAL
jgi:hypothetical protein